MTSHRILLTEGGFVQLTLLLSSPLFPFLYIFQYIGTLKGLESELDIKLRDAILLIRTVGHIAQRLDQVMQIIFHLPGGQSPAAGTVHAGKSAGPATCQ